MASKDIYEQLKKDHQVVRKLLDDMLESKETQKARRQELVERLKRELLAHSHAEERLLYNELEHHKASHDIALEGGEEHHVAEKLLLELEQTPPEDEHWLAKATVLKEMVCHHIDEEEDELFSTAHEVLDDQQAQVMLQQFRKEKQQEMKRL